MNTQKSNWYSTWLIVTALALIAPLSGFSQPEKQGSSPVKSRTEVYAEMTSMLGLVPTFMKSIPDSTLALEWELMKRVQMEPGPIPNKYRELIGVAASAATKCQYCVFFHTEMARLNGATDAEIEDALHYAKATSGWSTYINGSQIDIKAFKAEVKEMVEYAHKQAAAKEKEKK